MSSLSPHPIYSKAATVSLETGDDKFAVMQRAMEVSGFFGASRRDKRFPSRGRSQWLLGFLQSISRLLERLLVTKT